MQMSELDWQLLINIKNETDYNTKNKKRASIKYWHSPETERKITIRSNVIFVVIIMFIKIIVW